MASSRPDRTPSPATLWGTALAGCACAAATVALAHTSDHVSVPGVQGALFAWIILTYTLAGVVAWWRRPESRFGLLMVATGAIVFLSSLSFSNVPVPFTLGQAFDLVPVAVFLHVFLAYPSGRLGRWFERALVATAYVTAIGLELLRMTLGGFGTTTCWRSATRPPRASSCSASSSPRSACAPDGRRGTHRPPRRAAGGSLRRWRALLVDSFALGLVMIALPADRPRLRGVGVRDDPARSPRSPSGSPRSPSCSGCSTPAWRARASATSSSSCRGIRRRPSCATRWPRALRDPSLALVYWLPEFGSYADADGRPVELPGPDDERAMTPIERDGERVAALLHDPCAHGRARAARRA